ncbi:sugar ABC transporter substrate-binding protein [Treponema primitia]|uniref:sugar ABC transporter substrate-binding protein n=1 Tax=Treponema primitia TaxID=88058 RepID=UPI000255547F|nr:sugar ABC transporter substrate-binding protein [Treponema primitia]
MKKRVFLAALIALVVSGSLVFAAGGQQSGGGATAADNLQKSQAIDASVVRGSDGQLLMPTLTPKQVPPRPADPSKLPESDPGHWYDQEYAGWNAGAKINPAKSPKNGSIGKYVIIIMNGDHPYTVAYSNGAKKAAETFGMKVDVWSPNYDVNIQNQLVDQAINARPDAIGLVSLNAEAAVQQYRKINQSGIPVFGTNMLGTAESIRYAVTWTGPDDWAQMRKVSRALADAMGKKGGIAYLTHTPGGSPYFARMWGPRTELLQYAPDIKTLDFQSPGFDAAACKQVVADWITRFGKDLNAIFVADDSAQAQGAIDAIKEAGRTDILIAGAGNSKIGMDAIIAGNVLAISAQSAEGDGAAPVKAMADWFNGKEMPEILYIANDVITKTNVQNFQPPQW